MRLILLTSSLLTGYRRTRGSAKSWSEESGTGMVGDFHGQISRFVVADGRGNRTCEACCEHVGVMMLQLDALSCP